MDAEISYMLRVEKARNEFLLLSKPYFDALYKAHFYGIIGYDNDFRPIYSDQTEMHIQLLNDYIQVIKDKVNEHFDIEQSVHFIG